MEAAINALTGGTDYSNGAFRWDGFDLAAKGNNHIKVKTYGVEISAQMMSQFKAFWTDSKIKSFSGGKYTTFAKNFNTGMTLSVLGTEGGMKDRCLLKASAVHGGTMFWAINRNPIYKDSSGNKWRVNLNFKSWDKL